MGVAVANNRSKMRIKEEFLRSVWTYLNQRNSIDFLRHFIIFDEIWIHHYTPETKQE